MADFASAKLRVAVRVFLAVLLIVMAWRVLGLGMADARSRSNPEQALQWRPQHSSALFLLAERQAKNPDLSEQAKKNALAALRAYPFEGRAYRILGQLADAEKKPELALTLYQKAVRYSPRDLESHLWLMNNALQREDASTAVHHLDKLLRMQLELLPQLIPTVGGLAVHAQSQEALIGYMVKNPAWRLPAIRTLALQEGAAGRYGVFFSQLGKTKGGLTEQEQQAWVTALNKSQQWPVAYLAWANQLPTESQLELGNLFNGGFEHPPLGGEFDWQFDRIPGASIDLASRDGVTGEKALRVHFDDRRVPFNSIRQTLVLPAGRYRLSGKGFADDLQTEPGLVWTLECLGGGTGLGSGQPWKGSSQAWQTFSIDFQVPDTKCPAQRIFLKLPARIPSEQLISGSVWFDAFRIQRIQGFTEQSPHK